MRRDGEEREDEVDEERANATVEEGQNEDDARDCQ
jgi:hypothetical protein